MNLSNQLSEISKLSFERVLLRKQALYDYLVKFLKADKTELFPEMACVLQSMIQDDLVDLDTFIIFVKYFLGVHD